MVGLRVHLLGQFQMQSDGQHSVQLDSRKVQDFLGFLLLNRRQPCLRENLAEVFWEEAHFNHSKKYLRQALWKIQSVLGADSPGAEPPLLLVDAEWVQVNPEANLWLDVAELEAIFESVRGTPAERLSRKQAGDLKQAAELYKGDLLEGCYQDWCLLERERFRFMYHAILDKVIHWSEANRDYETGLRYAALILRDDAVRERTHRQMMRLHYLLGNRIEALRQYRLCKEVLAKELQIKPAKKTEILYACICEDRGVESLQVSLSLEKPEISDVNISGDLGETFNEILNLNQLMLDLFQKLQKEISRLQSSPKE